MNTKFLYLAVFNCAFKVPVLGKNSNAEGPFNLAKVCIFMLRLGARHVKVETRGIFE